MLGRLGRIVGFIDRELHLTVDAFLPEAPVHGHGVRKGGAVLCHRANDRFLVQLDRLVLEIDAMPDVGLPKSREVRVQTWPVERFDFLLDHRSVGVFSLGIDFSLGIQRVEHEAGGHGVVDVLELLKMIGVAADRRGPAGLEGSPGGVVEHIARSPMAAAHLADGLLGEDRVDWRADRSAWAFSGVVSATSRTWPLVRSVLPAKPRNADSSSATATRRLAPSAD